MRTLKYKRHEFLFTVGGHLHDFKVPMFCIEGEYIVGTYKVII